MNDTLSIWQSWTASATGLPTLQWSLLLALAAAAGHLMQRYLNLPKIAGYSLVGMAAGLTDLVDARWPLQGVGLFLLELGLAVVLFEAGARISLRWFRHNPMVLVQSLLEASLTYTAVYLALRALGLAADVAQPLALVAMAASPAVLTRVVMDSRAAGPVTDRAIVLSTLNTLYALMLGGPLARLMNQPDQGWMSALSAVGTVLGLSFMVAVALALLMRAALRVMSPTSENTGMLMLALIATGANLATNFGGSAALAALLAGLLVKQVNPRPWLWPRQFGSAASMLTMLMFVLVSTVAAQGEWQRSTLGLVLALVLVRAAARTLGLALASPGSALRLRQAFWTGCAMVPMSSVAMLLTSQFVSASSAYGAAISGIALPAILLMEVLGAVIATVALQRVGESSPRERSAGNDGANPTGDAP